MGKAKQRLAGALDGALQLPERRALDDERRGAGLEHALNRLLVLEPGERDHAGLRASSANLPRRLDAVQLGHADVHEHGVGLVLGGELDGLVAVGRFADDLDLGVVGEHCPDEPAGLVGVIADQKPDHPGTPSWFSFCAIGAWRTWRIPR